MFFTNPKLEKLVDDIFNNNTSKFSTMFSSASSEILKRYYDLPVVSRDENGVEIKLTLPGYEREDLEISIEDDELVVSTVENVSDSIDEFERTFKLMEDIDESSCAASMKAGILTISFQYKKPKKSKKIIIK